MHLSGVENKIMRKLFTDEQNLKGIVYVQCPSSYIFLLFINEYFISML